MLEDFFLSLTYELNWFEPLWSQMSEEMLKQGNAQAIALAVSRRSILTQDFLKVSHMHVHLLTAESIND